MSFISANLPLKYQPQLYNQVLNASLCIGHAEKKKVQEAVLARFVNGKEVLTVSGRDGLVTLEFKDICEDHSLNDKEKADTALKRIADSLEHAFAKVNDEAVIKEVSAQIADLLLDPRFTGVDESALHEKMPDQIGETPTHRGTHIAVGDRSVLIHKTSHWSSNALTSDLAVSVSLESVSLESERKCFALRANVEFFRLETSDAKLNTMLTSQGPKLCIWDTIKNRLREFFNGRGIYFLEDLPSEAKTLTTLNETRPKQLSELTSHVDKRAIEDVCGQVNSKHFAARKTGSERFNGEMHLSKRSQEINRYYYKTTRNSNSLTANRLFSAVYTDDMHAVREFIREVAASSLDPETKKTLLYAKNREGFSAVQKAALHGKASIVNDFLYEAEACLGLPHGTGKVDFSGVNLSKLSLGGAYLAYANLSQEDLQGADLREANLSYANLSQADLRGADLREANLSDANLQGTNLQGANLQGATLNNARLIRTNLQGANLQNARLREAHLSDTDFTRANLAQTTIADYYYRYSGLANRGIVLLETARSNTGVLSPPPCFAGATFGETPEKQKNLVEEWQHLMRDKYSHDSALIWGNSNLQEAVKMRRPLGKSLIAAIDVNTFAPELIRNLRQVPDAYHLPFDADLLDQHLNHHNNEGHSWLTSIDSINDHYLNIKVQLMQAIANELAPKQDQLGSVRLPLADVLLRNPDYLKKRAFAEWLIMGVLEKGNTAVLTASLHAATIAAIARYISEQLETDNGKVFAAKYSMAIYQLLHRIESDPATAELRQTASNLRDKYNKLLPNSLQDPLKTVQDDDKETYFPLLSTNSQSCLFLHHGYFENRVMGQKIPERSDGQYEWGEIFAYKRAESSDGYKPVWPVTADMFQPFPLLASAYAFSCPRENKQIITQLQLGKYDAHFKQALDKPSFLEKLVSAGDQNGLMDIFEKVIARCEGFNSQYANLRVKQTHLKTIARIYNLSGSEKKGQLAHQLLWLSALFTHYSSSHVFGTEKESPDAVRQYAAALLNTACELDSTLITPSDKDAWITRFAGTDKAFTCTAVLYNIMKDRLRKLDDTKNRRLYASTIPAAWRNAW
jgi:uncharacterized protein YjbI with pentapeptide repeats